MHLSLDISWEPPASRVGCLERRSPRQVRPLFFFKTPFWAPLKTSPTAHRAKAQNVVTQPGC